MISSLDWFMCDLTDNLCELTWLCNLVIFKSRELLVRYDENFRRSFDPFSLNDFDFCIQNLSNLISSGTLALPGISI